MVSLVAVRCWLPFGPRRWVSRSPQAMTPGFYAGCRRVSRLPCLCPNIMPRPPPLQLQFDNMFPGIVRPRLQVKSLLTGVYQSNWRMLLICVTTINALRFFVSATGAMDDRQIDIAQNNRALANVSKTLAIIYTITCGIEMLGAFSVFTQRRTLIRAYAYLAFLSAALVTGAGFITTIAYFAFADDLVRECIALATTGQLGSKSLFRGDPWPTAALSADEAQIQCLETWSSESTSQVIYAALFYFLPSVLFCFLAYIYYYQTSDPAHPANFAARGSAMRLEARGSGAPYVPLQDEGCSDTNNNARPVPVKRRATISPRSYHSQTAQGVAPVSVTSGSSLSPGPPSFSVGGIGDARSYHGFRLSAGPEDETDTFI
ncbi:hypothetical protein C8R43DRAFT_487148 [Mycena crocata]|nr:hypothetical protein C8R43DRAFT_487148 [Mycena crocata]